MLTGKAKDNFLKQFCGVVPVNEIELNAHIIDWFDSVGIYVNPLKYESGWKYIVNTQYREILSSRQEAISKAIKKASDFYNKNNI
jgi:hypothetical protein